MWAKERIVESCQSEVLICQLTGNISKEQAGNETETGPWRQRKELLEVGGGYGGLAKSVIGAT